ncbi:phosphoenolpyruvate carboxykinase (GTP) [Fonticula alba]|uniref:phosphoenolpyruvate carboxykinase (GTP) n=1 Tax=Fonticula alba TaxID=691883 RepID=A0A058Z5J0_FONAL|nr:phosphoenolpyruvate carboxykinase (GTP) [Fonticula alba]KCV69386.1 phosphoenolpyruvate carboxykinase (GTP) [Fonticula alba]|eukprot:XP_009495951.1 phosphoenolpyruvate carboxykinase (GTP) [Fonticula alba]
MFRAVSSSRRHGAVLSSLPKAQFATLGIRFPLPKKEKPKEPVETDIRKNVARLQEAGTILTSGDVPMGEPLQPRLPPLRDQLLFSSSLMEEISAMPRDSNTMAPSTTLPRTTAAVLRAQAILSSGLLDTRVRDLASAAPGSVPYADIISRMVKDTERAQLVVSERTPLQQWLYSRVALFGPSTVHFVSGSAEEEKLLSARCIADGTMKPLNPKLRPNCFIALTDAKDVARSEESTFVCPVDKKNAGPTNNWRSPVEMKAELKAKFNKCMEGRTLYVVPFLMGPKGSKLARVGVQLTDSPYVVLNMKLMARVGLDVLEMIPSDSAAADAAARHPPEPARDPSAKFPQQKLGFVPCHHSVGVPLHESSKSTPWPCNIDKRVIAHFPDSREIWSFGSGYGGNALLGKKCLALRIASAIGREEGWFAEHMLILGLTSPTGKKHYIAAAFPSACGKTNLAMLRPSLPGWSVSCVGDDIAWMRFDSSGQLRAINPERGFFGVAPGTSELTNPSALAALRRDTLFTNCATTMDGDVWWEGLTPSRPEGLTTWQGTPGGTPNAFESLGPAAHPNARFTVSAERCPSLDPAWQDPEGVPISAIVFGGRRASTVPLVYQSRSWEHGVFMGATLSSERTAAAEGQMGEVRFDPFAMLPFCGYHMGDYFQHWLETPRRQNAKLPPIFHVNWFRRGPGGNWLWPGFGENARVLRWIAGRIEGTASSHETPIGFVPTLAELGVTTPPPRRAGGAHIASDVLQTVDAQGNPLLSLVPGTEADLLRVDRDEWRAEVDRIARHFETFGDRLPTQLSQELETLRTRTG